MGLPALSTLSLGGGVAVALEALPDAPGVVQLLAADGRNLIVGRGASMRAWAAHRLGQAPPPPPGKRPPLDLSSITATLRFAPTCTELGQLLLFERTLGAVVPAPPRPDLKPPAWIHVDAAARFPRLSVVNAAGPGTYGPFRTKDAAQKVVDALNGALALRACDFVFDPHPEWATGVQCLFAQVGSCAAPCLSRVTEDAYRASAMQAVERLASADAELGLADWQGAHDRKAWLVEDGEVYPFSDGQVVDGEAPVAGREDWAWLVPWLTSKKRKGFWVPDGPGVAERLVVR